MPGFLLDEGRYRLGWDAAIVKENAVITAMNHSKPGRSQHVPAFVMHLESSFSATILIET